jgi:hypothetical protein
MGTPAKAALSDAASLDMGRSGAASGEPLPGVFGDERASDEALPESSVLASRPSSGTQAAAFPVELIGSQLRAPREPASCWTW